MTFPSSLRSRIFLTSALLAVLSIGAAIALVSFRVARELELSLRREIASTGTLVEQLRAIRAETFTTMARLIADAPRMKAAVDTKDPATVQANVDDYQHQLNSRLLLVTDRKGEVLATVGAPARTAQVLAGQPSVRRAAEGREGLSLVPQPDGILQLATVPILLGLRQPDVLGSLSVGFLWDDAFAGQLKQITGSDIAFGMDGQILASTLPLSARGPLAAMLREGAGPHDIQLGSEEYVVMPLPLSVSTGDDSPQSGAGPVALILRSRTEQLRFLSAIHTELVVTAVATVLLATLLSFAVARTITQPLAAITGAMREVSATGDLTRKIVLPRGQRWDDADARLLAATFNTLIDSIARAQREISQRERLSSLGRLSTVIAHEVRNPLMIIKTALHTLRQPDAGPEEHREAVADINGEVARLNRIVDDVLDFARPIQFDLGPADVNALCRESATAAQASAGPAVALDLDPGMPSIVTDAERLRVALVNLLVNARQAVEIGFPVHTGAADTARAGAASAGNRPPVVLSTRLRRQADGRGDQIAIQIADAGTGIDDASLPKVFDPYFTTKRGGTGLGLPIAKNIIEGLGGAIAVSTGLGRGTTIEIEFPLARPITVP